MITNEEKINAIDVVVLAGEVLLHNGAEIFRVQETMTRIAEAFGVYDFEVYVISNGIFMSISENGEHYSTAIKHIPLATVHLGRVAEVNNLSRKIVIKECNLEEAYHELNRIKKLPYKAVWFQIACAAVGSGCFCYLLGGTFYDCIPSFIAGTILYISVILMSGKHLSKIMLNICASAVGTFCSVILFNMGLGTNIDSIVSASIISLVPGVAITTSIRDFFNGDYLSGTIRLIDALFIAFSIAAGVGGILMIWHKLFGGYLI